MAVIRHYLQCEVCGKVTMLRTQLGYVRNPPIRFTCGHCGILISGTAFFDPDEGTSHFEFSNAQLCDPEVVKPTFHLETSGEFLIEKMAAYNEGSPNPLTPFIRNHVGMGDNVIEFTQRAAQFLKWREDSWPRVRRVNELWLQGNSVYLPGEVQKILPKRQFPMNNELECLRGVHTLNIMFFNPIIHKQGFWEAVDFIQRESKSIDHTSWSECFGLLNEFQSELVCYERKLFDCMSAFVDIYPHLIPVYGFDYITNQSSDMLDRFGISTASLADIKMFYVDGYEVCVEVSRLLVAYNNIKHRGSYNSMAAIRRDVQSLSDYDNIRSKGKKLEFITGAESYDFLLGTSVDNNIRNALGHNTYKVDPFTQMITFYPNGREDDSSALRMYMAEFSRKCWELFQTIIILSELVYSARKLHFFRTGQRPASPSLFAGPKRHHRRVARKKRKK